MATKKVSEYEPFASPGPLFDHGTGDHKDLPQTPGRDKLPPTRLSGERIQNSKDWQLGRDRSERGEDNIKA